MDHYLFEDTWPWLKNYVDCHLDLALWMGLFTSPRYACYTLGTAVGKSTTAGMAAISSASRWCATWPGNFAVHSLPQYISGRWRMRSRLPALLVYVHVFLCYFSPCPSQEPYWPSTNNRKVSSACVSCASRRRGESKNGYVNRLRRIGRGSFDRTT